MTYKATARPANMQIFLLSFIVLSSITLTLSIWLDCPLISNFRQCDSIIDVYVDWWHYTYTLITHFMVYCFSWIDRHKFDKSAKWSDPLYSPIAKSWLVEQDAHVNICDSLCSLPGTWNTFMHWNEDADESISSANFQNLSIWNTTKLASWYCHHTQTPCVYQSIYISSMLNWQT